MTSSFNSKSIIIFSILKVSQYFQDHSAILSGQSVLVTHTGSECEYVLENTSSCITKLTSQKTIHNL